MSLSGAFVSYQKTYRVYRRIQEEGLRTYLFTNSASYTTLYLPLLVATFSLPQKTVSAIISCMIYSEELSASLDHVTSLDGSGTKFPFVIFYRVELTRLQQLAQTVADKVSTMVETNEKALSGGTDGTGRRADADRKVGGEGDGKRTERVVAVGVLVAAEVAIAVHDLLKGWAGVSTVAQQELGNLFVPLYLVREFSGVVLFEMKRMADPQHLTALATAKYRYLGQSSKHDRTISQQAASQRQKRGRE